jgi:hypothetical protein
MNIYLQLSSGIFGLIHVCAIWLYTTYLSMTITGWHCLMLVGIITSLLNHSTTSGILKAIDRIYMISLFVLYIIVFSFYKLSLLLYLVLFAGILFVIAKYSGKNCFHVTAHCVITIVNIIFMTVQTVL